MGAEVVGGLMPQPQEAAAVEVEPDQLELLVIQQHRLVALPLVLRQQLRYLEVADKVI